MQSMQRYDSMIVHSECRVPRYDVLVLIKLTLKSHNLTLKTSLTIVRNGNPKTFVEKNSRIFIGGVQTSTIKCRVRNSEMTVKIVLFIRKISYNI